jgi:hypothetical protein
MPKSPVASKERRTAAEASTTASGSPVDLARESADAMFRAAVECCHQHDRVSRIGAKTALEEELTAAQKLCALCDEMLRALADTYERTAASVRPQRADDSWWRCANSLWLASREYTRRNTSCDAANKDMKQHGPGRLGELHTEYELEASALLGLRQAAEGYQRCRPAAV